MKGQANLTVPEHHISFTQRSAILRQIRSCQHQLVGAFPACKFRNTRNGVLEVAALFSLRLLGLEIGCLRLSKLILKVLSLLLLNQALPRDFKILGALLLLLLELHLVAWPLFVERVLVDVDAAVHVVEALKELTFLRSSRRVAVFLFCFARRAQCVDLLRLQLADLCINELVEVLRARLLHLLR